MNKRLFKYCVLPLAVLMIAFYSGSSVLAQSSQLETLPKLVLSELQTGGVSAGVEDGKQEFIELYNPATTSLDVTDWRIEYLSANHNGVGAPTRTVVLMEGEISAGGYALFSYESFMPDADGYFGVGSTGASGLLARSGGHVRIVDADSKTVDLIGWGTGVAIGSWWRVPEIPAGSSVQRVLPGHDLYGSALGFVAASNVTTPRGGDLHLSSVPPPAAPRCVGLVLSELLPNPSGPDAGKEFIEVHNPTADPVRLKGCTLRLGEAGKVFELPDEILQPMAYRAFLDSETGLTLPNATPQTVWLLSTNQEEGVLYGAALGDDVSWARVGTTWLASLQATPSQSNVLTLPPPVEAEEEKASGSVTSCPEGKERNPATGRCRTPEGSSQPLPCKPGQTRNPETNRCRAVIAPASLTPCGPGQERSLETNRCRSTRASVAGALQPCEEGQERNAETNRCRKIPAASSLPKVEDVATPASAVASKLWIGGALGICALSYAIYEWRQDILRACSRFKQRMSRR